MMKKHPAGPLDIDRAEVHMASLNSISHRAMTDAWLHGQGDTFGVGQAAGEVVLLEAMELAAHAPPQPVVTGSRSRNGAHGDAQPKGLLAESQNEIVRFALNNRWLEEQGVPNMNAPAAIAAWKIREA